MLEFTIYLKSDKHNNILISTRRASKETVISICNLLALEYKKTLTLEVTWEFEGRELIIYKIKGRKA